ncbi:MAG: [LysW]-lysine hydrolase [Trueperaceae bacterium]|nr:[LysW]-lysine hydrolase [Trueperaceae bacterium]
MSDTDTNEATVPHAFSDDDAIDLLKNAVSIPSLSGQEQNVAEYLVGEMGRFADEAFVDGAGNAVARLGSGDLKVTFLGHIDTVPGVVPVRREDDTLFGRGVVDAKGAFCTAVAAASRLEPSLFDHLTLTLIGAVEEESPTSKGARHALQAYPKPDMLVIGEPSGWDALTLGYKGRLVLKLSLQKDNFHSAGDDTTAAEDMVAVWQRISSWAERASVDATGIFDRVQVALQEIHSESDGLTQHASATIGFRLPPDYPPDSVEAAVREQLTDLPVTGLSLTFSGHEQPHKAPKDTALSRAFRVAIRQQGGTPRFKLKTGTADMNVVAPFWDVPMLAYGPGDSSFDHRPDEQLPLADYRRAIAVLHAALSRLAHP